MLCYIVVRNRVSIFFFYVSETDAEMSSSMPGDRGPPQAAKRAAMTGEEMFEIRYSRGRKYCQPCTKRPNESVKIS